VLSEEHLNHRGIRCRLTREPGGTEFGVAVRRVLLRLGGAPRAPMSELLLYLADRHQHLKEIIEPALAEGTWILSDRYHDATRAYQGAARGIPPDAIDALARLIGIPEPDGTVLLDLDPAIGLARARKRNAVDSAAGAEGRFEAEALSFHEAVREAYLRLARHAPGRIRVVKADDPPEQVFSRIRPILDEWVERARPR
jgi:dTMP kinase